MIQLNKPKYSDEDIKDAIDELHVGKECNQLTVLVSKGYDIHSRDIVQLLSFSFPSIELLENLAKIGFDVNKWSSDYTPFWFGLIERNFDIESIKRISSLPGIDFNTTDKRDNHILLQLDFICINYIEDELDEEASLVKKDKLILPIIKFLIEKCADDNIQSRVGSILFKYREYPNVLAYLLTLDLDLDGRDRVGRTAFMGFCRHQDYPENAYELTKQWLQSGVDIYAKNTLGGSPYFGWNSLMYAVEGNNVDTIKLLLKEDFELTYKSPNNHTAFTLALGRGNKEIIDILADSLDDPYLDPAVIQEMVKLSAKNEEWQQVIEWGEKLNEADISTAMIISLMSSAYQKTGNMEKSLTVIKKGIDLFGLDNLIFDALVLAMIHAGQFNRLVTFWFKHKSEFKADEGAASNIIANLIVAFDQVGKSEQAIIEFAPLLEDAQGTQESKSGLINFNLACMYAKKGDENNAVEQLIEALEGDFIAAELKDSDFDNIRNEALFKILTMYSEGAIYLYFEKENETQVIYTRDEEEYELISYINNKYSSVQKEFKSTIEMLKAIKLEKEVLLTSGFKEGAPDFVSIWLPAFDNTFKSMLAKEGDPLTEFRMEWDFCHDEDEKYNPLERPYYCYSEEGFENDDGYDLLYIPLKKYHAQVMGEVIKLASFKQLKKSDEVKLIQSEHDSGDEFEYVWRTE